MRKVILLLEWFFLCQIFCQPTLSCNRQFETNVDPILPFDVGLCEKKLWRFYQVSNSWIASQSFGSTIQMKCRMFSSSTWLSLRLTIVGLSMWKQMGCWWKLSLMAMLWISYALFLKITMAKNNKSILKEDFLVNLVIKLSVKIIALTSFISTSSCNS